MVANAFQAQTATPNDRPQGSQRTVPNAASRNNNAIVACTSETATVSLDKLREVKSVREIAKSTRTPTKNKTAVTNQFEYLSTGLTTPPARTIHQLCKEGAIANFRDSHIRPESSMLHPTA